MLLSTVTECKGCRTWGRQQPALLGQVKRPHREGARVQGPQGAVESPGGERWGGESQERVWQRANDMAVSRVAGEGAQMVF